MTILHVNKAIHVSDSLSLSLAILSLFYSLLEYSLCWPAYDPLAYSIALQYSIPISSISKGNSLLQVHKSHYNKFAIILNINEFLWNLHECNKSCSLLWYEGITPNYKFLWPVSLRNRELTINGNFSVLFWQD